MVHASRTIILVRIAANLGFAVKDYTCGGLIKIRPPTRPFDPLDHHYSIMHPNTLKSAYFDMITCPFKAKPHQMTEFKLIPNISTLKPLFQKC